MYKPQTCPRILIVEDDADQRLLVCEALRMCYGDAAGKHIVAVGLGQECLARDLDQFDVILLDYNLPDTSGLALLGDILARRDIPVVFVTGENDSGLAAEAIQRGAQDYVVKLGDYLFAIPVLIDKAIHQHHMRQENQRLQQELRDMLLELRQKNQQLQESLEKLEAVATTDHLTGLANRRRFSDVLERTYSEASRYGFDLTCCMCDLDHYKQLNDSLGHQVGDDILVLAADIIRSSLRGTDMAARYGGDEFVLLLPHTSMADAMVVCERIRRQFVTETARRGRFGRSATMSMGMASLECDRPASADALVSMADRALYVAKDRGKDRIVTFHESHPVAATPTA